MPSQAATGTPVSAQEPDASRPGGRRYRTSRPGGRRYRSGRPADPRRGRPEDRPGDELPEAAPASFPALAGAPKALARMFTVCLLSCLLAGWLHLAVIGGLGYCAGCVLVTRYTRREALLHVVISAPVIFLVAVLGAQLATAGAHRTVVSALEGTVLILAAVAPWLLAGTAGGLVIAMFRGLRQCVHDLRAGEHAEPPGRAGAGGHGRDDLAK